MPDGERSLAVFIDFENLALGFQGRRDRFDIARVLERLVEKGKIVAKKAYADWSRFGAYTGSAARGGHRADRNPPPRPDRQELRRHPPVRRCHGPGLLQGAHRHLRHRLRRQRFLAAGLQAQGTRQARHRPGHAGIDLRPAARQLRRVHLLRGPRPDADAVRRRCRPAAAGEQAQGVRACCSSRCWPCGARTRKCSGRRWSRTR